MIKLQKMSELEFAEYLKISVPNFADEKMKGEGLSKELATKAAQESFDRLLPQKLQTENQFLFSVIDINTNTSVGILWFGKRQEGGKSIAYIYDVMLSPESRGKGYGKQVMSLLEDEVRKQGLSSIGLHVFGHNTAAINLYEKTGFRTTNRIMMKDL